MQKSTLFFYTLMINISKRKENNFIYYSNWMPRNKSLYYQLINFDKVAQTNLKKRIVFSTNSAVTTGYTCGEERSWTPQNMEKLTQLDHRLEYQKLN